MPKRITKRLILSWSRGEALTNLGLMSWAALVQIATQFAVTTRGSRADIVQAVIAASHPDKAIDIRPIETLKQITMFDMSELVMIIRPRR